MFDLPIECELNKDCFIQNLPDILVGEGVSDSFCQGAAYDGHKGIDIRPFSLKDIEKDIPVIASADGTVRAFRDGEPDKLILTQDDKQTVQNKECGNGVVLVHSDGFESQYCHLKQNSIAVENGQRVKQGELIGFVGNSGLAEFPHVHLSIRKNGQWLDPISGKAPGNTCEISNKENSLLTQSALEYFTENTTRLLSSGVAGNVIQHGNLVKDGAPPSLQVGDKAVVGWAWFINLRKGDQIRFSLEGPSGLLVENTTEPQEKHKADYSAYTGKKRTAEKGEYRFNTELLRDGKVIAQNLAVHIVE